MLLFLLFRWQTLYQKNHSKCYKGQSSELRKNVSFFSFCLSFELNWIVCYNVVLVYWLFELCICSWRIIDLTIFILLYLWAFARMTEQFTVTQLKVRTWTFLLFSHSSIHEISTKIYTWIYCLLANMPFDRRTKSLSHIAHWLISLLMLNINLYVFFSYRFVSSFLLYEFVNYYRC